jgi:hypothetical protein
MMAGRPTFQGIFYINQNLRRTGRVPSLALEYEVDLVEIRRWVIKKTRLPPIRLATRLRSLDHLEVVAEDHAAVEAVEGSIPPPAPGETGSRPESPLGSASHTVIEGSVELAVIADLDDCPDVSRIVAFGVANRDARYDLVSARGDFSVRNPRLEAVRC